MLKVTNEKPVPAEKKVRYVAAMKDIDETLHSMADGSCFPIAGKIRRNTVKRCAKIAGIKIKISKDENGAWWCWKIASAPVTNS